MRVSDGRLAFFTFSLIVVINCAVAVMPLYGSYYQKIKKQNPEKFGPPQNARQVTALTVKPQLYSGQYVWNTKFRPNNVRCCNVGEKAARRARSCDSRKILDTFLPRDIHPQSNLLPGSSASEMALSRKADDRTKIERCYQSHFAHNLNNCCRYRLEYVRGMEICRKYTHGNERRRCRQEQREKYPR